MQIAQTFGVRTHLVGIKPARGSQSPDLIQEADTHHEWSAEVLVEIMSILPLPSDTGVLGSNLAPSLTTDDPAVQSFDAKVQLAIDSTLDSVDQKVLDSALLAFKANSSSVPPELDRPTLGHLRALLARDLTDSERKTYRATFRSELAKI